MTPSSTNELLRQIHKDLYALASLVLALAALDIWLPTIAEYLK